MTDDIGEKFWTNPEEVPSDVKTFLEGLTASEVARQKEIFKGLKQHLKENDDESLVEYKGSVVDLVPTVDAIIGVLEKGKKYDA
tara:strand:- start:4527 stop:4778 length:252 start_codon:yes stop_codon:yes gene_type:complete